MKLTREEAITRIKDHIEIHRYHERNAVKIFEALDMAIKALEQPEPCENAVSRTEVLRMINCINDHHAITPYKSVGEVTEHLTRIARNLPPVTPKQHTGKWIPSDSQCGIRCSACGVPVDDFCHSIDYIDLDYEPNFCPNCGERMKEVSNEIN